MPLENLTMLKSYISKGYLLLVSCLLFSQFELNAQDQVDDNGPSICDCAKYAKTDPLLLSRCEQKFDYNILTSYERLEVERMMTSCLDPDVCDCANLGVNDSIIAKSCSIKYNQDSLSEKAYEDYLEEKSECIEQSNKPPLKTICECLEPHDAKDYAYEHCKGIWDISSLSPKERKKFVAEITGCIENKDDPNFTLSLCDCMNAPKDDLDLKERCIEKFDLNSMSSEQIASYREETKNCNVYSGGGSEIEIICDCIKEEQETGRMSGKCENILKNLEEKYKNKSPEEMKEFIEQLMDCIGSFR